MYVLQGALFISIIVSPRHESITFLGTFAETSSPEHQLHWIIENCRLVRSLNGLSTIVEALKIASSKHDLLS